ncbi:Apc15p protein-domain-containing protein [Daldinia caldariorum]|uniref:Apc15p protein-domain-containing protein n=1 Tax=Daldinia caldariorum TaxID=326644 RepID=UPI0020086215|nr:Apc15p protein-domain-containing protein [Daldinia caldariorum]KAI1471810.1 Apc15p protein-domain-containing protein [Daldinia caldariorum]
MLSLLPDLTPRDSHSLWYTSSRNPLSSSFAYDANPHQLQQQHQPQQQQDGSAGSPYGVNNYRRGAHLVERSPLARLRVDEQNLERRRLNVANFGSAWLKPPGIPKTLHQLREERREAEEHQEALRREQLAQELAEAEAAGVNAVDAQGDDGVMDDVQLDGARDLDEDIPEADADFGIGSDEDEDEDDGDEDDEDEDEDDDEDDSDDDDSDDDGDDEDDPEQRAAYAEQQLIAQQMRQADDAFRESAARGRDSNYYGVDDEVDDEDQAQMIEEDDLLGHGDGAGMDMDADLDDDIPEAEDGGYEHTDSEVEMSSDEDEDDDQAEMSFAAQVSQQASQQASQQQRLRHSLARSDATRHSLAISDILSHDGDSIGSSPQFQRRASGAARRARG